MGRNAAYVWSRPGPDSITPPRSRAELTDAARFAIKQVRSGIGHPWRMRATLEALGLRHHQQTSGRSQDRPSVRGRSSRCVTCVEVTPVEE